MAGRGNPWTLNSWTATAFGLAPGNGSRCCESRNKVATSQNFPKKSRISTGLPVSRLATPPLNCDHARQACAHRSPKATVGSECLTHSKGAQHGAEQEVFPYQIKELNEMVDSVQATSMQSHLLDINAAIEGSHARIHGLPRRFPPRPSASRLSAKPRSDEAVVGLAVTVPDCGLAVTHCRHCEQQWRGNPCLNRRNYQFKETPDVPYSGH